MFGKTRTDGRSQRLFAETNNFALHETIWFKRATAHQIMSQFESLYLTTEKEVRDGKRHYRMQRDV